MLKLKNEKVISTMNALQNLMNLQLRGDLKFKFANIYLIFMDGANSVQEELHSLEQEAQGKSEEEVALLYEKSKELLDEEHEYDLDDEDLLLKEELTDLEISAFDIVGLSDIIKVYKEQENDNNKE